MKLKSTCLLLGSLLSFSSLAFAQPNDHGAAMNLGTVQVLGHKLTITRLGAVEPGKEAAFQVDSPDAQKLADLNVYLWVEDSEGKQVSAPGKGIPEGAALHFHLTPKMGTTPKRAVLRVRADGKDEKAALPLDGHGHDHAATPHEGVVAKLFDESKAPIGFIELKLHDDKGDLELWLAKDSAFKQPLDIPLTSSITVTFVDVNNRSIELRPRNQLGNEDENGLANVRAGSTNYFIYPSSPKDDAAWLKGAEFQSVVNLRFSVSGKQLLSEEFLLVPHTHGPGGHDPSK